MPCLRSISSSLSAWLSEHGLQSWASNHVKPWQHGSAWTSHVHSRSLSSKTFHVPCLSKGYIPLTLVQLIHIEQRSNTSEDKFYQTSTIQTAIPSDDAYDCTTAKEERCFHCTLEHPTSGYLITDTSLKPFLLVDEGHQSWWPHAGERNTHTAV